MLARQGCSRAGYLAGLVLVAMAGVFAGAPAGAQGESESDQKDQALVLAARTGQLDRVRALLAENADPDARSSVGGRTALMSAISQDHLEVARVLIAAGASMHLTASNGETPLMLAVARRSPENLELVRAMLAAGVDVNSGEPPVHDESESAWEARPSPRSGVGTALGRAASVEVVQALLAAKAQVDARQFGWSTPLIDASASGRADVIRVLLSAGADIGAKDNAGNTALMRAATNRHPEAVNVLLAADADVNARRLDGSTALMLAMHMDAAEKKNFQNRKVIAALSPGTEFPAPSLERMEVVQALLAAGADVGAAERNGNTALMLASATGHREVVRLLLAAKADVNARRRDGGTALMLALQNDDSGMAQLLRDAGATAVPVPARR